MTSQARTGRTEPSAAVYPHEDGQAGTRVLDGGPDHHLGQHTGRHDGRADGRYDDRYDERVRYRGAEHGLDGLDTRAQTTDSKIADPGPLGLSAFALTTFVLSVFNAGIISNEKLEVVVLPLALFYGGIAQLLAGMWEFKKGNTFGATAFSSFGAFWLSYAAYAKFIAPSIEGEPDAYKATGLFLLAWTIFAGMLFFAAIRISGALGLVFASATAAFVLLTLGALSQNHDFTKLGGILGLVAAGCAWYTSWAGVLNDSWKRTVLPILEVKQRH
jgi:succinate-acetate transporter protein